MIIYAHVHLTPSDALIRVPESKFDDRSRSFIGASRCNMIQGGLLRDLLCRVERIASLSLPPPVCHPNHCYVEKEFLRRSPASSLEVNVSDIKPFKTIDEQITILESRGLIIDDRELARRFLTRNNYYSLVNGYKEFFLDMDKTNEDVEVFRDGTRFIDLMTLYNFDAILRFSMMHCLTIAEKALKTATVHAFCKKYRNPDDYLDPASYCSRKDYRGKNYTSNLIRLLSTLQGIHDGRGERRPYIDHYRKRYGYVPLWVMANALTFGNMSHFYSLQTIAVQNETCHLICQSIGADSISARKLGTIYSTLTTFRNTCAHGGRLFCKKAGPREDKTFGDMLTDLSVISAPSEIAFAIDSVLRDLETLSKINGLRGLVERKMGLDNQNMKRFLENNRTSQ